MGHDDETIHMKRQILCFPEHKNNITNLLFSNVIMSVTLSL